MVKITEEFSLSPVVLDIEYGLIFFKIEKYPTAEQLEIELKR